MTATSVTPPTPTMMSLTAIRVTDLRRSREFYSAGCGFVEESAFSTATFDAVILRAGPAGVELVAPRGDTEAPEHGNMFVKLVLSNDDVAGLLARACASGGTEELAATVLPEHGRTIAVVRDPDGHQVEIVGPVS